jgi:hypothetical protein
MARKIHEVPNGPAGDTRRETVKIETAPMAHHPGKILARIEGQTSWKGPWDDERTAIRSLCMIYGIGGM